jgi:hypothetical protein
MRVRLHSFEIVDAARAELGRRLLSERKATIATVRNYLTASVESDLDELVRAHERRVSAELKSNAAGKR